MIPARMGSQRLPKKNLALLAGVPLIVHAIRKCYATGLFDEVWVNSEHPEFGAIAEAEGAKFHQRPAALGDNNVGTVCYRIPAKKCLRLCVPSALDRSAAHHSRSGAFRN